MGIIDNLFYKTVIQNKGKIHSHYKKNFPNLVYKLCSGKYSYYPDTIFISINSTCNLKCKMCDVGQENADSQFYKHLKGEKKTEIPIERLKKLIDEVKFFKPLIAVISTEPLIYKDIVPFLDYAVKNGLECQLTTNGLLLSKFVKEFVEMGLQYLWISLDGPPEIHDEIRGFKGSFEKAYEAIKEIVKLKKELGKDKPNIYLNYTISNLNDNCLYDFYQYFKDLPISQVVYSHLNYVTEEMAQRHNDIIGGVYPATPSCISVVDPKLVRLDVLSSEIKKLKELNRDNIFFIPDLNEDDLKVFYTEPFKFVRGTKCRVVWQAAQLISTGELIPVTRCFGAKFDSIMEMPFMDAWNGEKIQQFRMKILQAGAYPACTRCCAILG